MSDDLPPYPDWYKAPSDAKAKEAYDDKVSTYLLNAQVRPQTEELLAVTPRSRFKSFAGRTRRTCARSKFRARRSSSPR